MFIYSVKAQKIKFWAALTASTVIISTVIALTPTAINPYSESGEIQSSATISSTSDFKNIKTNEDRVDFLKKCGWEVQSEPREIAEVDIPSKFNKTYEQYNRLQTDVGLNLEKYKGKAVKRYTYLVLNYEYEGTVLANLLIYNDRVIGGDISSAKADGFMHGLMKENSFLT